EVRVELADVARELARQHHCLAKAADAVRRRIAPKVAQELLPCGAVAGEAPRGEPTPEAAQRFAPEIFRQVEHGGAGLAMNRVDRAVGRTAKRDDAEVEAALLESADLLGNEGLGEARIALEDDGDRRAVTRGQGARSGFLAAQRHAAGASVAAIEPARGH